jgi:peroxiredoxin
MLARIDEVRSFVNSVSWTRGLRALGMIVCGLGSSVSCGGSAAPAGTQSPEPAFDANPGEGRAANGSGSVEPTVVVERPPDFELDTLSGESVRLHDLLGSKVILLDFWATYCDPCLAAMPHLQEVYTKHRERGFVVLGISIDGPESAANVRSTVAKLGVQFPILLDEESRVVALYNPRTSAPYSVLIGRDGRVVAQQEGFTTGNAAVMDDAIAKALAAP